MNKQIAWKRLTEAARCAPDPRDTGAPYGFSVRVAALAMARENRRASLFDSFSLRVSLRVLGAASALAIVAAGAGFPAAVNLFSGNLAPETALSSSVSPAGAISPQSPAAVGTPSLETSGAAPSTGEDPVSDLVGMVS